MDEGLLKCPVCGKENKYIRYSEWGFGIVELHYYCHRCTYFAEQCYSPVVEAINNDSNDEYIKLNETIKNKWRQNNCGTIGGWIIEEK